MPFKSRLMLLLYESNRPRVERGEPPLSLLGLARETSLPYSVLHKLANNRAVRLDLGTMERLIRFFGVSGIDAILEYTPDEPT